MKVLRNCVFGNAVFPSAVSIVAMSALSGCWPSELTEKPPRLASPPAFPTAESLIGAQGAVSYSTVSDLINQKIPKTFSANGNGDDICADLGLLGKHCAGTSYNFSATAGNLTVTPVNGTTIRVAIPVGFSGQGGFRGDGCRYLSCNAKNFNGGMLIHVDLVPSIDASWCPTLSPTISYSWTTNPRVEIAGGIWVDVSGHVSGVVNGKLGEITASVRGAIDCNLVKAEVQKIYGSRSFPFEVPGGAKGHVNLTPTGIGFSGFQFDPSELRLAAMMKANVEVAGTPIAPASLPLPPLQAIPAQPPSMKIAVPIRAPHSTIQKAISDAIAGKTFSGDSPLGPARVTVKRVEIYPSAGRMVIGLSVEADLPKRWLDVSGDVYLLGKPVVDSSTRIRLDEIGFARKIDNDIWNAATGIFEKQIVAEIRKAAVYDFSSDVEKAKAALMAELGKPSTTPGIQVKLEDVSIALGRLAVADQELAAEGVFSGKTTLIARP